MAGLVLMVAGCRHEGPAGEWPAINAGCEQVRLYFYGAPPPPPGFTPLGPIEGSWDEPDKNLRNWLVNKACARGASAVVDVVETTGSDEDGPVYNIRGVAVMYPGYPPPR